MAKQTVVTLIDDIDGKPADETVTFALDGVSYELDLTNKNADKFRGLFQDYIAAGRKTGKVSKGKKAVAGGPTAADVRGWAKDNGIDVPARGRIPQEVRDAFDSAN